MATRIPPWFDGAGEPQGDTWLPEPDASRLAAGELTAITRAR